MIGRFEPVLRTWPAAVLMGGGLMLLVASLWSDQWLVASGQYDIQIGEQWYSRLGLFSPGGTALRAFGSYLAIALFPLAVFGIFTRWALIAALPTALSSATLLSLWYFDVPRHLPNAALGRGYVLGMVSLGLVAVATAMLLSMPHRKTPREIGEVVDGKKHGRWHVYDTDGTCIAIEEWDHGTLLNTSSTKSP